MGFNKRMLPNLSELIRLRESMGDDMAFLKSVVGNSDCIMGNSDAIDYVNSVELEIFKK